MADEISISVTEDVTSVTVTEDVTTIDITPSVTTVEAKGIALGTAGAATATAYQNSNTNLAVGATVAAALDDINTNGFNKNANNTVDGNTTIAYDHKINFTAGTAYDALNLANNNIIGVNKLHFADAGFSEGIDWENIRISETNDALTANAPGDLHIQFKQSDNTYARRFTVRDTGVDVVGTITFDGGTTSADLNFGDDVKALFGAGSHLQIFHDSSTGNSKIREQGTGNLIIEGQDVLIRNVLNGEAGAKFIADGTSQLHFDGSKKIETTSNGVAITDTATATTFSGDLNGTINTATTATTQSQSNNSTKVATTAYVDTAVAGKDNTDEITEGSSNLYFTNARADARISNAIKDEDNMGSNSATHVPSQQSVKAYVDAEVAGIVDSAPGTLNTLNELAGALGDDASFSTTVTNSIATKLPLAGGQMTGSITFSSTQTVDGRDLSVDGAKLDLIEAQADVTDATNVAAAGALMDSEVTNLAQVKAFDSSDYVAASAVSAFGGTLIADTDAATARTTLGLGSVENTAISAFAGTSNITTVGTITAGTWQGTAIADTYISSASAWNAKQEPLTFGIANDNAVEIDGTATSGKMAKFTANGITSTDTISIGTNWTLEESGTDLLFKYGENEKARLSNTGVLGIVSTEALDNVAPVITSANSVSVEENTAAGTDILALTATDSGPESDGTVTFSTTHSSFSVDSSNNLQIDFSPNFEATNSYTVPVVATDSAGNTTTQNIAVTITDVDESPSYDATFYLRSAQVGDAEPWFGFIHDGDGDGKGGQLSTDPSYAPTAPPPTAGLNDASNRALVYGVNITDCYYNSDNGKFIFGLNYQSPGSVPVPDENLTITFTKGVSSSDGSGGASAGTLTTGNPGYGASYTGTSSVRWLWASADVSSTVSNAFNSSTGDLFKVVVTET